MATDAVMKKVKQVADLAGLRSRETDDGEMIVIGFDMGEGRSQQVFIRSVGNWAGHDVIEFQAPCRRLRKGFMQGLGKNEALDLLRRNAKMLFGHFSLYTFDDEELLFVCSPQIVDTMEVEEFTAHVRACCLTADAYEKECGSDEF